jgi:uncharacterized protein (TIGR00255 family)
MALSSMTGFARSHGATDAYGFEWEIRSINAKGFDLRLRLPSGWDAIEAAIRKRAAEVLSRGTVYANLSVTPVNAAPRVRINDERLAAVLEASAALQARLKAPPPAVDGLLAIKGVVDVVEPEVDEAVRHAADAAVTASFETALKDLLVMRRLEGASLGAVLQSRLSEISDLAARADSAPGRQPDAVKQRLAAQVALLLESSERLDADRLHQEAVLLAAKADIREELDRIASHVGQARDLLAKGGPVGRRLDFLSQELNREVNTCCSKSNDLDLTNLGLDMKNVVEQFREQVQNLE